MPGARAAPAGRISPAGKRALLLCAGLLLLLELAVARPDWVWRLDPRRPVGIMLAVEDELLGSAVDVSVVVLGSSAMRDAVLPRAFEEAAGLPAGSVVNASLPNATPFDFAVFYRRNRESLRGARLMIVGVEDWHFYEEPAVSERYHRWASLSDRWSDYAGVERLPLLVSWLWKTYAARRAFALDGLVAAARGERAEVIGDDGRVTWRPLEIELGSDEFDLAPYEARLSSRVRQDRQVRYLGELVELAEADGVLPLIVRMPMRDAAFRRREQLDPDAERRLHDALAAAGVDREPSSLLDFPTGSAAGLEERHFLDERHLGAAGARIFSVYLGAWTRSRLDLE